MTAARRAGESALLGLVRAADAQRLRDPQRDRVLGNAGRAVRLLIGDRRAPALLAASIVGAALALPALPAMIADCLARQAAARAAGRLVPEPRGRRGGA